MAEVVLDRVRKVYPQGGHVAIEDSSFSVGDGERLVLVGPSGCGKSTLLRMIAGLESITGGTLSIGGRVVNDLPPKERDIAMVFQSYALYPHMSVARNLGFALELRGMAKDEMAAKPLVLFQGENLVAMASEESAIRAVLPQEIDTYDPYEREVLVWSR